MINNKKILIIGGTGSLGKSLTKYYKNNNQLYIVSRDEWKQWNMKNIFNDNKIEYGLSDISNTKHMELLLKKYKPNIIIIASALKHINICEENISQCIDTNLNGIQHFLNTIELNINELNELEKVLLVSTDKACSPVNVYGMCKAISERMIIEKSYLDNLKHIKFLNVRYGNVLNSRGSIIPVCLDKIKRNEEICLTDENMTRFFMTLDQSVNLIDNCLLYGESGDTWIPKLKSMYIKDLLNYFCNKYNKILGKTNIRNGEKLHEDLINKVESMRVDKNNEKFYVIKPYKNNEKIHLENEFEFTSKTNLMTYTEIQDVMDTCIEDFNKNMDMSV
jgi:FlaA1/EpsC-like NDP-sugar epimerase